MRKVTKILAKTLSATILLLIILPLSLSLALTMPAVQHFAVDKITQIASSYIGSRVEVGSVHFSMIKNFSLYDVEIDDLEGRLLIKAERVDADISLLSIRNKSLTINDINLENGKLHLRENDDAEVNLSEIIKKITDPEKSGLFRTVIKNIEVESVNVTLERQLQLKPQYGVDLSNIDIMVKSAKVSDLVSQGGVTELSIDSFKGREVSGLDILTMRSKFTTYEGVLDFVDVNITTPYSLITLPRVRLESSSWEDYKDFNSSVSLEVESQASIVSLLDVAYFAPQLKDKDLAIHSFTALLNGTIDNLESRIESLAFGDDSRLSCDATVRNIDTPQSARFNISLESLETNISDIETALKGLDIKPLDTQYGEILRRVGSFRASATTEGSLESMGINATLSTWLGGVSFAGDLHQTNHSVSLGGLLTTKELNIGAAIDRPEINNLDLKADINYAKRSDEIEAQVKGEILSVGYKDINFSDIELEALLKDNIVETSIVSNDQKADLTVAGMINLGEERHYDITARVGSADFAALGINKKDSLARFSGSMRVNLGGNTLDELSGSVTLRNITYDYNDKSVYTPIATLTARNSLESKYIEFKSDYLDMTFNSRSSFDALFEFTKNSIRRYIPTLYNTPTDRTTGETITLADNYSTLSIEAKNLSPITNIISEGFDVADNSSLNLMVNPFSERFSMRLSSDYIQHGNLAATDLNINASNDNDSLTLFATAADIFIDRYSFSTYSLMAGARDNVIELSTGFRDLESSTSATLGMRVGFDQEGKANVELRPSNITLGGQTWLVSADNIAENRSEGVEINNFEMVSGEERLTIEGVASNNPSDSLVLRLNNYDIGVITSAINTLGYDLEGVSNGYINMSNLWGSPRIMADISLDSVALNSIPSPPLKLSARWSSDENRAKATVTNAQSQDTVLLGYFAPAESRYYAQLKVDSLNVAVIDPLLAETITDTKGYANVDVSLSGQNRDLSLHGGIDIYDLSTKVIYTQVEYNVPSAYIAIEDNHLSTTAQNVFDNDGNQGLLTLKLSLDQLSNVSYMLRIVPENMMVLNTTSKDNELFYGTIFATGVATIEGDRRGVNIDITATSNANSNFYMPLSTQSTVAKTDFITFVKENLSTNLNDNRADNFRRNFIKEREKKYNDQAASVNVNLALHATPDLDFQLVIDPVVGDIIKARGEGRLNLAIAPQDNIFEMYGDYNINEGNYLFTLLNPISKRFVIDPGSSIQWTGNPLDPQLDIAAVYKVKTSLDPLINSTSQYSSENTSRALPVDCIINLGDRLSQPSVKFNIEVPTADTEQQAVIANTLIDQETISQQFFYLMFANSFIPVSTSYGGINSSTTAATGFELLTNQLSNWLSSSNYNVVIRYRPESDLTSDEVDVGFSRGLINNRLLIEVEGNYLADNKAATEESNFSNFMGEAYVTWLIDKAGALRLKGFTQTIDQYDENQGLQETGIGVYYTESFNNLKELRDKVRNRFRKKKKKQKNTNN